MLNKTKSVFNSLELPTLEAILEIFKSILSVLLVAGLGCFAYFLLQGYSAILYTLLGVGLAIAGLFGFQYLRQAHQLRQSTQVRLQFIDEMKAHAASISNSLEYFDRAGFKEYLKMATLEQLTEAYKAAVLIQGQVDRLGKTYLTAIEAEANAAGLTFKSTTDKKGAPGIASNNANSNSGSAAIASNNADPNKVIAEFARANGLETKDVFATLRERNIGPKDFAAMSDENRKTALSA